MSAQASDRLSLLSMTGPQRLLEIGALLNTTAFFAAMPFAPLYLASHTGLSKAAIGAVVGALYLIGAFGLAGGYLVDRLSPNRVIQAGLVLTGLIYGLLMVVRQPAFIVTLFVALGPARLLVEPGAKKQLSLAAAGDARVFRRRYMTWCVGAVLGPAITSVVYPISPVAFFAVPTALYAAYFATITIHSRSLRALETGLPAEKVARGGWRTVIRDRRLLAVIAGGLILFFVFSQLESMIPLYMRAKFGASTEKYFAVLFILNAVLAVAFQIPIDKLATRLSRGRLILLGATAFAASFALFWANSLWWPLLYLGVVFWTVGEGALVPIPDMLVHEIAVDGRKGLYFGLSDARQFGFFAGPVVGGLLLAGSTAAYFAVMGAAIFACVPFLLRAARSISAEAAPTASASVETVAAEAA